MDHKYFTTRLYRQFIQRKFVEFFYPRVDNQRLVNEQRATFQSLGLNYDTGLTKLNQTLVNLGMEGYDEKNGMMSQHWVAFSAISEVFEPGNILEIGTFNARSTYVLSQIFPSSQIDTIELPDDSPHFVGTYNRENTQIRENQIQTRTEYLSKCPNVTLTQTNSFAIGSLFKDKNFDLIWIDGDHNYPAVAWDLFFGVAHLNSGGWLMADDFYLHPRSKLLGTYNESFELVEYLAIDQSVQPTYIHKRTQIAENVAKHKHILILKG